MSSRLCSEYPRKAERPMTRGIDWPADPGATREPLATELLTADVPVAAMAPRNVGPPGEIRGGFSFEPGSGS